MERTTAAPPVVGPPVGPFTVTHPQRAERWLKMIVYSNPGAGKTFLAGTAEDVPSMRDILYIDAEGGDLTLQNRPDLNVIRINSFSQMARIHDFLRAHCRARDAGDVGKLLELHQRVTGDAGSVAPPQYRTVVIDSLSELAVYCLYQVLGVSIGDMKLDQEPEKANFAEYMKLTQMMRLLIRTFRDLPMNVIFTCLEKAGTDGAQTGLLLTKALSEEAPAFVDVVGRLVAGAPKVTAAGTAGGAGESEVERRLYLQPTGNFLAKNRFTGFTAPFIIAPTMEKIVKMVK